jgi:hypothetical protein
MTPENLVQSRSARLGNVKKNQGFVSVAHRVQFVCNRAISEVKLLGAASIN